MFNIVNFDSWGIYDGAYEGSGRSEKVWLISPDGQIGLFKFPKIDAKDHKETTEHVSEHLAHQLGCILNIPTAKVDIGYRNGRIGSMSYLVCKETEILLEGINFISGRYPKYNVNTLQDEASGMYYCIDQIISSVPGPVPERIWVEMMLFDFLIGNADRHQSNWAFLLHVNVSPDKRQKEVVLRRCPLYDNGSSLCCYANSVQVDALQGKDQLRFESFVDSKSRSLIRIDGSMKKHPSHREVVRYLLKTFQITTSIAEQFIEKLHPDIINALLNQYPPDILDSQKNQLIRQYLFKKLDILKALLDEKG